MTLKGIMQATAGRPVSKLAATCSHCIYTSHGQVTATQLCFEQTYFTPTETLLQWYDHNILHSETAQVA